MKFVFDIDDTILFSEIDDKGNYHLKNYDHLFVQKINNLYDKGHQIILWTGRHWNHLDATKRQLEAIELKYHTLILGKPVSNYYIDDKAMKPIDFMNRNFE